MVLLLLASSGIYFISGKPGDGFFLAAAIVLVAAISLYQDSRSRNALEKLKDFSQPKCKVIRNGEVLEIDSASVQVITVAPSFGATDIERLVSYQIEQANINISGLKKIRSFSRFGLSLVVKTLSEISDHGVMVMVAVSRMQCY